MASRFFLSASTSTENCHGQRFDSLHRLGIPGIVQHAAESSTNTGGSRGCPEANHLSDRECVSEKS
jgi:hypothetical protein